MSKKNKIGAKSKTNPPLQKIEKSKPGKNKLFWTWLIPERTV